MHNNQNETNKIQTENGKTNNNVFLYSKNILGKEKNTIYTSNAKQLEENNARKVTTTQVVKKKQTVNISSQQVTSVVVAVTGAVVGVTATNILPIFQSDVKAEIVNIESYANSVYYDIDLTATNNGEENIVFEDAGIVVTLTNDFVNCDCDIFGSTENNNENTNIIGQWQVFNDFEENKKDSELPTNQKLHISGFFEGLQNNMQYDLLIRCGTTTLDKKSFRTKYQTDYEPEQPQAPPIISAITYIEEITEDSAYFEIGVYVTNPTENFVFGDALINVSLYGSETILTSEILYEQENVNENFEYTVYLDEEKENQQIFVVSGFIRNLSPETNYTFTVLTATTEISQIQFTTPEVQDNLYAEMEFNPGVNFVEFCITLSTPNQNFNFNEALLSLIITDNTSVYCENLVYTNGLSGVSATLIEESSSPIFDYAVEQTELEEMLDEIVFIIYGSISNLTENTEYTLGLYSGENVLNEKVFSTLQPEETDELTITASIDSFNLDGLNATFEVLFNVSNYDEDFVFYNADVYIYLTDVLGVYKIPVDGTEQEEEIGIVIKYNLIPDEYSENIYHLNGIIYSLNANTNYSLAIVKDAILDEYIFDTIVSTEEPYVSATLEVEENPTYAYFDMELTFKNYEDFDFDEQNISITISDGYTSCIKSIFLGEDSQVQEDIIFEYTTSYIGEEGDTVRYSVSGTIINLSQTTDYTLTVICGEEIIKQMEFSTTEESETDTTTGVITLYEIGDDFVYFDIVLSFEYDENFNFEESSIYVVLTDTSNTYEKLLNAYEEDVELDGINFEYTVGENSEWDSGVRRFIVNGTISNLSYNTVYTLSVKHNEFTLNEENFETGTVNDLPFNATAEVTFEPNGTYVCFEINITFEDTGEIFDFEMGQISILLSDGNTNYIKFIHESGEDVEENGIHYKYSTSENDDGSDTLKYVVSGTIYDLTTDTTYQFNVRSLEITISENSFTTLNGSTGTEYNVTTEMLSIEPHENSANLLININVEDENNDLVFDDLGIIATLTSGLTESQIPISTTPVNFEDEFGIMVNYGFTLKGEGSTKTFELTFNIEGLTENTTYNLSFTYNETFIGETFNFTTLAESGEITATISNLHSSNVYMTFELTIESQDENFEFNDANIVLSLSDGINEYEKTLLYGIIDNSESDLVNFQYNVLMDSSQYTVNCQITGLTTETSYTLLVKSNGTQLCEEHFATNP